MNHVQKQSIIILINSIESQLQSLKALVSVGITEDGGYGATMPKRYSDRFTSENEDRELEEALGIPAQDKNDIFLQDIFRQAADEVVEQDGTDKPE